MCVSACMRCVVCDVCRIVKRKSFVVVFCFSAEHTFVSVLLPPSSSSLFAHRAADT